MNQKNKETASLMFPANVRSIIFRLSTEALVWLDGTTRDDNGIHISNRRFFHDLLVRMQFSEESEEYAIPDTHLCEASPSHSSSSNIKYIDNQLVTVIKIQMICKCKYKTI